MSPPSKNEKPAFLTSREWAYIQALKNRNGVRFIAAEDLKVQEHAIENVLSRIRRKVESAYAFKGRYGKLIERKR